MFKKFETDNISIIKKGGNRIDNLKANIQSKGIFLFRGDVLVEIGDKIERLMSNGGTEQYEVLDPGFHEKISHIPAHYQMKVQKLGLSQKSTPQSVVYNISGNVEKINHQSVDNSVNINNNIQNSIKTHLASLKQEIEKINDIHQKDEAMEVFKAIEEQSLLEKPNKTILKSLISSLPPIDNILSITSTLMSFFIK